MNRSWHHWQSWECTPAGMYGTLAPSGYTAETALKAYTDFLADLKLFEHALKRVTSEWPISCEQFLSNSSINRIAWLGQSSMCITTGIPRQFKAGFAGLSEHAKHAANAMAAKYLVMWQTRHGIPDSDATDTPAPKGMQPRIAHYVRTWEQRDYSKGIPDEVPSELMRLNLAPSHKAIALAVLKNDHSLSLLGYSQPVSPWYGVLKRIELSERGTMADPMF